MRRSAHFHLTGFLVLGGIAMGASCTPEPSTHESASSGSTSPDGQVPSPTLGDSPAVEPPLPDRLDLLDPAVVELIQARVGDVKANPQDPRRWLDLALVYESGVMYGLADRCYTQALSLAPSNARAWYHRSLVRRELGDMDKCVSAMRRVIELNGTYAPAHWRLGLLLLERTEFAEAEDAFRRAIELAPDDSAGWLGVARVHLKRGENRQAAQVLESLLSWTKKNVAYANRLLGTAYQRLGRPEEARAALNRGRGSKPDWSDPWANDVYRVRPRNFGARVTMADALVQTGRYDQALTLLLRLKQEQPENVSVLTNLGAAYLATGHLDESIETSKEALAFNPDTYLAEVNLAAAYKRQAGAGDPESSAVFYRLAMEHVDRALALNPTYGWSHALKADLLCLEARYEEAMGLYLRGSQLEGGRADWLYRAGVCQCQVERWEDAVQTLEKATAQLGDSPAAFYFLGVAHANVGNYDRAEAALRRAEQLAPDDPRVARAFELLKSLRASSSGDAPIESPDSD